MSINTETARKVADLVRRIGQRKPALLEQAVQTSIVELGALGGIGPAVMTLMFS